MSRTDRTTLPSTTLEIRQKISPRNPSMIVDEPCPTDAKTIPAINSQFDTVESRTFDKLMDKVINETKSKMRKLYYEPLKAEIDEIRGAIKLLCTKVCQISSQLEIRKMKNDSINEEELENTKWQDLPHTTLPPSPTPPTMPAELRTNTTQWNLMPART